VKRLTSIWVLELAIKAILRKPCKLLFTLSVTLLVSITGESALKDETLAAT